MSYGSFGNVVFEVSSQLVRTLDDFAHTTRASYAEHKTVSGKPSLEFTGQELDEIDFTMTFVDRWVNPQEEDDKIREMARSGEANALIIGDTVYGTFVIEEVNGNSKHFIRGKAKVISVDLKLKEYDPPTSGAAANAQAREARRVKVPDGMTP